MKGITNQKLESHLAGYNVLISNDIPVLVHLIMMYEL